MVLGVRRQGSHIGSAVYVLVASPRSQDCGFTIEDSYKFWKQELCRDSTVDAASFEKNYAYDVDHTYGAPVVWHEC